ncbi:PLCH1 phosphodiesterase, partial [Neodrepanis coruscans]|nr:PLCH1 phosphodiesterase [Neodrepanis coruscans]
ERQEAGRHRAPGVVLRNRPSASPHATNRHSTGSIIASCLPTFPGGALEGRGAPEGSCSALQCGERCHG